MLNKKLNFLKLIVTSHHTDTFRFVCMYTVNRTVIVS